MKKNKIYWIFVVSVLITGALFAHQLTLTKVGEWGTGCYFKVFVKGNYAYCAAGYAGLDIINIANPANPQKVGNYETPGYLNDVTVKGNYAYAADGQSGLQIIDISSPSSPQLIGTYDTPGSGASLYVYGNYVYVADGDSGLQIIDVSTPAAPTLVGNFPTTPIAHRINRAFVVGKYAYVAMGVTMNELYEQFGGLIILDISNPASPQQVGSLDLPCTTGIYVSGNYAFLSITAGEVSSGGGLAIIDVTNPSSPVKVKLINELYTSYEDVDIKGNYAYCAGGQNKGVTIIDISNPTNPTFRGSIDTPGWGYGVHTVGNYAYVASGTNGLQVIDVSDYTNPVLAGTFDNSGYMEYLQVSANHAYTGNFYDGEMQVIDISTPASPTRVGVYEEPVKNIRGLFVKGKYAYAGYSGKELRVIDITVPTSPVLTGTYENSTSWYPIAIDVSNNKAYVADFEKGLTIIDVSTPASPSLVKQFAIGRGSNDVQVRGNYAYMTEILAGLLIIDISNPSSPTRVGSIYLPEKARALFINGNYAYVASEDDDYTGTILKGKLYVVNVANPASPTEIGSIDLPAGAWDVYVSGNYAYVACGVSGLKVIDISKPASPTLAASYDTSGPAKKVAVKNNYIYVANGEGGKLLILQSVIAPNPPRIHLNRTALYFAATDSGAATVANPQTFFISNTGESTLEWSISEDQQWLNCSPTGGIDSGEVTVYVDAFGLSAGTYTGEITVSDPDADNSPQQIAVTLKVYGSGQTSAPFGQFDTPVDGSTVYGSIPVTGWVLDDIGVQRVQIFREDPDSLVNIGNAVFVDGARPDVEQTYPGYPMNYKAGWGYMLLTHYLPGGNGVFTLYAIATDAEGNMTTLGVKTITVDNAHAVKPFGTIDTPTPGWVIDGRNYLNFGWVLTPQPNTIPFDGSTIHVWVDGVKQGSPVYNQYREDIPALFPGYNNSGGAVGYFDLDTTQFANGVHTISWTATDDAGNSEGIGSRYFSIQNTGADTSAAGIGDQGAWSMEYLRRGEPACSPIIDHCSPVNDRNSSVVVSKGYDKDVEPQQVYPDRDGNTQVEIKELERVAIQLKDAQTIEMNDGAYLGYLSVGNRLKPLPIGSTMDAKKGIFYWQPGPGFVGSYRLVFIKKDSRGQTTQKNITVKIIPKFQ